MHNLAAWSISLGRWGSIHVRLHALFLLFAGFTLFLATEGREFFWYGILSLAVLFLSVLLHELAHVGVASRFGGRTQEIVIAPLGGLAPVNVPHDPQSELSTALAGPLVNVAIALAAMPFLYNEGGWQMVAGLLNPLHPQLVVEGSFALVLTKLIFWLNWVLVLVNMLPALPFDGGLVLRAILWPALGYRTAILAVSRVALLLAVILVVAAALLHNSSFIVGSEGYEPWVPPWVPLGLIAMFLFFSAKQERWRLREKQYDDEIFGYDFSRGYASLERSDEAHPVENGGLMRRWLEKRREERERQRRENEAAEEVRVDEILARLHSGGMESLSLEERSLLNRVSARYRNRSQS